MKIRNLLSSVITTTAVSVTALGGVAQAAGTATFSLSPASGSYANGASLVTTVYETSAEAVNTVQADLTYDAGKLQFVGISTVGSPFTTCTNKTGGSGKVSIVCAILGGSVSGKQKVGSVTFKALASSGSTSVSVAQSSMIVSDATSQDIWNHANVAANYSLKAAPKVAAATTTRTPVATTRSTTSSAPAETPKATEPATTEVAPALTKTTTPVAEPTSDTSTEVVNSANRAARNFAIAGIILAAVGVLMYYRNSIPGLKSINIPELATGPAIAKKTVTKKVKK